MSGAEEAPVPTSNTSATSVNTSGVPPSPALEPDPVRNDCLAGWHSVSPLRRGADQDDVVIDGGRPAAVDDVE